MTIVNLEMLLGRKVRDSEGSIAGRLAEVHADWRGDECIVTHYVIASAKHMSLPALFLHWLGAHKNGGDVVVTWDKLDLRTMRMTCRVADVVTRTETT